MHANQHVAGPPLWDRVWARVKFPRADLDKCWIWTGALSRARRGKRPVVRDGHRVLKVARVVCGWYHGLPPTPDHEAGHTCPGGESARCVNPRHLRWQTRLENEQYKNNGVPF